MRVSGFASYVIVGWLLRENLQGGREGQESFARRRREPGKTPQLRVING